ncbi:MAG: TolC family protein [Acidaminococcaceae bacterium]|jgi:outer membrane protein TolC|nr:TolC family protein [Acidaminococcaceae bacterium]
MKYHITKNAILGAVILSTLSLQSVYAAATPATVDLNLEKAVHMALVNNSGVKIAKTELAAAKAQKDQAKGARWGSLSATHYSGRYEKYQSSTVLDNPANTHTNSVSLALPIYTGGKLEGNIEKAAKNLEAYKYGMEGSYQTAEYNATKGYYDVLNASNSVALCTETVNRLADHLKNTEAQFNVGVVAKVDVLTSQVNLADAQQSLTKAQNSYDYSVASLDNVLGLPQNTKLNLSEGLEYKAYNNTLDNCITYAMTNNPSVHQAELAVDMAKAAQKVANAGNIPQVNLAAENDWAKDKFPGSDKESWAVGVNVSWNFWDYGVTAAKVAEAKANVLNAQETYRQTSDSIRLSVRNSYLSLREAEKRIGTSSVSVAEAEEAYRIAVIRYQAGVGTNTDVIDASVYLTTAKNNYITALYDYNTSLAALKQGMGVPVITD